MRRFAENNVNYQERAKAFSVGDTVTLYGQFSDMAGKVTAVWPGIGMADVEFVNGSKRVPVEDLQRFDKNMDPVPPDTVSTPGGQGSYIVTASASRVASRYKKALYWASRDRQYRMNRGEVASGRPCCPRCPDQVQLKPAIYKRRGGGSEKLLGCPNCMFLIKDADIVNFGPNAELEVE